MPYIGRDLNRGNYLKLDDISSSFNSSTTTFNLTVGGSAFTPGSAFSILVSVGGVIQEPESAYQVNNSEITFANAPTAQDSFFCIALAVPLGIGVPGNGTVNGAHIAKPFNYDGFFYLDDANNRVGIGSLTPTVALDVIGNTNISGILTASSFTGGSGGINAGVVTCTGLDLNGNGDVSGNFVIGGDLTVNGTTSTIDTNLIGVDRVEVGANSSTITGIAVTQSGTADLVRLYDGASQVVTIDDEGNVGVGAGAATPHAPLHIRTGTTGAITTLLKLHGPFTSNTGSEGTSIDFGTAADTSIGARIIGTREAAGAKGALRFCTGRENDAEFNDGHMVIDETGKIGINTTDSSHLLTVFAQSPSSNLARFKAFNGNSNFDIHTDGSSHGQAYVRNNLGAVKVALNSNGDSYFTGGKVGIGTDSPLVQLHVDNPTLLGGTTGNRQEIARFEGNVLNNGILEFSNMRISNGSDWETSAFRIQRIIDVTRMGYIDFGTGASSASGGAGRDIRFGAGDGTLMMHLDSTGRVGIGTDDPQEILHAHQDTGTACVLISSPTAPQVRINPNATDASDNDRTIFGQVTTSNNFVSGAAAGDTVLRGTSTGNLLFGVGTSEKLRIDSNGDVGINQTNPTQKLHVGGSIKLTAQLMQSMPADFWSQGNTFIELNGIGNLTHMGGFETNLTSNGYRDTSGNWVSYAANSEDGAAQIGLKPQGSIVFRTDASKATGTAHNPTVRLIIDDEGVRPSGGVLNLRNSGSTGNVTVNVLGVSGDSRIDLENTGNGNYSAIDFIRERSSGTGVNGGSIFMKSDTSSNDAFLYLQAQSASAQSPVTSALQDDNGVRLILKGGDGIFSVEAGASEKLKVQTDGVLVGGHTRGVNDASKLSVLGSSSNLGILQVHMSAGTETAGDLAGIAFGHGGTNNTSRPKVAIASRATGSYGRGSLGFYVDGESDNNPVSAADEKLRINTTGDIGINYTGTPAATLDIRTDRDPSTGVICFIRNNTAYGNGAFYGMDVNNVGNWNIGMPDNTNALSITNGGNGNSGTEYLRVASNGELTISGTRSGNSIPDVSLKFNILDSNGNDKKATIAATKVGDINSELIFSTTVSHAYAERLKIDSSGNLVQSGNVFAQSSASNTVISTTRTTEGVVTSLQSISNPVGRVGTTSNHSLEVVAYNNPAFTVDASGGILAHTKSFVSKFHYNPGIQSTGGWSTNWNTIIPGGTLSYNDTYVITAYWQHNHNGGNAGSPYLMQASFLYSSVSVNNTTGGNVEFVPFQTAHVGGGTHRLVFRMIPVGGHTTAGVQVKNPAGFHGTYGGITVKAHVLSDY